MTVVHSLFLSFRVRRWWLTLSLLLAVMVSTVRAAEPLAVISLRAPDDLISDVEYLLEVTGTAPFGQFIMPQVKGYLQGIDGKKPIGLVVSVEDDRPVPMGFLPVTNLKAFLTQLEPQLGTPTDAGDGVLQMQGPQSVYVKEQDGWAYIAQSAEDLEQLPDPREALGDMDTQYDLAIRAHIENIPEAYKQMALGQIKTGLEQGLQNADDPNARAMAEAQVSQLTQLIAEAGQLTLGWGVDREGQQTYLDISMTARPGTKLAEQLAASREAKTDFAGFLTEDAAISLNMTGVISPDDIPQTVATLENVEKSALREIEQDEDLPDDAARAAAQRLVTTFFAMAKSTIETGKLDSCTSVILKEKAMTLVSAAHVASGSEVESAVKQLVEIAKNEPDIDFSSVKFNADEHAGVRFHTMSLDIPEEEYARRVLGDKLNIVVGAGETSAYLAVGSDGLDHLKRMIDESAQSPGKTVEPFRAVVALGSILKFAQSVEDNPIVGGLAETLAQANGKDHILIRTMAIPDGITYRFLLEEGVLRAIGQGIQMNAAQGF
jgi:hypothetical protein